MAKKYTKRKDGRYCTTVGTGKINPETGKEIRMIVYGRTIEELEQEKSKLISSLCLGTYANDGKATFSQCADKWYRTMIENSDLANHTKNDYAYAITLLDKIGSIRLRDLKKSDFQEIINAETGHPEKQRRILMTAKQILNFAMDDELVYKNVCASIKLRTPQKKEKRALTAAEKAAIKKCDFTPMEKIFVYTLFFTGMRKGEVLALSRQNVNMADHSISVVNSLEFVDNNQPRLKEPKTANSLRTIHMPEALYVLYADYLPHLDSLYIVHGKNGAPISQGAYRRFWYKIRGKINAAMGGNSNLDLISGLSPHTFRHNYATMLYDSGVGLKEAQYLLGHSSIKITLEIYTHLEEQKIKSVNKLDSMAL